MKTSHLADGSQNITGSTKRHIGSRLYRAFVYASHLVSLLRDQSVSHATNGDILEACAYSSSLQGSIDFEKQHWEKALRGYSETRLIYASLAKSMTTKQKDVFQDLLTTTIDPSIRYAAYQLKISRTTSIESVVLRFVSHDDEEFLPMLLEVNPEALQDFTTAKRKGPSGNVSNVPKTIQWRSRTVNLEDSATAQALAEVSAAEDRLSSFFLSNQDVTPQAKAAAYDEVLLPSQEAADATKTAIDELLAEGIAQSDRRMQSLQVTRTAVNYALVGWRVGRNRVLSGDQDGVHFESDEHKELQDISKKAKKIKAQDESIGRKLTRLRERVVLYDSTLQSLDSVKELPGVAADQNLIAELDTKRSYFATLKYVSIGRAHAQVQSMQNALCLFSRALDLISDISEERLASEPESVKPPRLEITHGQIRNLHGLIQRLVFQHQALMELQLLKDEHAKRHGNEKLRPLVERLDQYPQDDVDLTNLVTYPPQIETIPIKPIFLDVAFNYIEYPGRSRKVVQSDAKEPIDGQASKEEKKEGRKGWFGFGR